MNKERILALADLIEKQPHTSTSDKGGFSMTNWHHNCGTPSCIAGWAVAMRNQDTQGVEEIPLGAGRIAEDFLGLDHETAEKLFCPPMYSWEGITPSDAAYTLRLLAETGDVEWVVS